MSERRRELGVTALGLLLMLRELFAGGRHRCGVIRGSLLLRRFCFRQLGRDVLPPRDFLGELCVELCLTLGRLLGGGVSIRIRLALGLEQCGSLFDQLRLQRSESAGRLRSRAPRPAADARQGAPPPD